MMCLSFCWKVENDSDDDEGQEKSASTAVKTDIAIDDKTFPQVAFAVDKAILREVEEMEEKVFTASLQVKVNKHKIFYTIWHGNLKLTANNQLCFSDWLLCLGICWLFNILVSF